MKKILFIVIFFALIILTGCDDDPNNTKNDDEIYQEPEYRTVQVFRGEDLSEYVTCSLTFTPAQGYGSNGYYIVATVNSKSSKYEFSTTQAITIKGTGYIEDDLYLGDNGHGVFNMGPFILLGTGDALNSLKISPTYSLTIKIYE